MRQPQSCLNLLEHLIGPSEGNEKAGVGKVVAIREWHGVTTVHRSLCLKVAHEPTWLLNTNSELELRKIVHRVFTRSAKR